LKRRRIVGELPYGEVVVFGAAMGALGYYYHLESESMNKTNHMVMRKLIGQL
jgi:hypothetical protein